jgi:tRNA pseudouridine55 synthase
MTMRESSKRTSSGREAGKSKRRPNSPNGFVLNVYKEIAWTSHDAVARIRRILDTRRVGHAGTLDPLASGVLVIGVGRATKLLQYLVELPKTYRGTLRFGVRTESGDGGGRLLETGPIPDLDLNALQQVARGFEGGYEQIPPMVSAVKQNGKRLYDLAREGKTVQRAPPRVEIERFDLLRYDSPRVDFEVVCGKGTYVRALVEDLAERVGTVAAIESLTRTAIGSFTVDESARLISRPGSERAGLKAVAIPMGDALLHLPQVAIREPWAQKLRHGVLPPPSELELDPALRGSCVRLLGPAEELLGLGRVEEGLADDSTDRLTAPVLRLEKVF